MSESDPVERRIIGVTAAVAGVAFLVSLFLPVGRWGGDVYQGYTMLSMGPMGLLGGLFGWCANPRWVLALVLLALKKVKDALRVAVLTFVVALSSFQLLAGIPMDVMVPFVWIGASGLRVGSRSSATR